VCKDRGAYKHGKFGLWNSASLVVNAIQSEDVNCKLVAVIDANYIDKEVYIYKPNIVIIEAIFVTPQKIRELVKLHPNVKWVIRLHSKISFLANEGNAFNWINEYSQIKNVTVSTNNLEINNDLKQIGYEPLYLPNIYTPSYELKRVINRFKDSEINIGCFGALRPMKNTLAQAVAAIRFADKIGKHLKFHINENSDGGIDNILKNLRAIFSYSNHKLVEHSWMPHKDFCKLVSTMDIGMQVSFTESFNIVTADFVYAGIPVVVCKEIKFVNSLFKCDNNTEQMIRTLYLAYYGDRFNLQYINKHLLDKSNREALREWTTYVSKQS